MKKSLISILTASSILLSTSSFAFYDVPSDAYFTDSVNLLTECGIISGKTSDIFDPYAPVTRAELAKLAVVIADKPESSGGSMFNDVSPMHWANGYISSAAIAGFITGYPGGSFAPDSNLNFSEAITVTLRLLGYTDSDIYGSYPDGYIKKAVDLGLTDGLAFNKYDTINRACTSYILAKAFICDKKTGNALAEDMKLSISDECTVLADYQNAADELLTSNGVYKYSGNKDEYIGVRVKLVTDENNNLKGILPVEARASRGIITGISGNSISIVDNGQLYALSAAGSSLIYRNGSASDFSSVKSDICAGDMIYYTTSSNGILSRGVIKNNDSVTPQPASSSDLSGYTLIKDSVVCTSISDYDTAYLYPDENVAIIWSNKISGIFGGASPSKANPTTITISGTDYTVSSSYVSSSLSSVMTNDTITAALGRNNEVTAVYAAGQAGTVYGIGSVTGNELICYNNGVQTTLRLNNSSRVFFKGKDTTFESIKNSITDDMQITVYYTDDTYDYSVIEECELTDASIAASDGACQFTNAHYYIRDGKLSSLSSIKKNDVLYYSAALDTVYAYCDTVLGVYEKAYPNKKNPTSIDISGKRYDIETAAAAQSLSYAEYDTYVTALLGRDGKIAGISTQKSINDTSSYGTVLKCSKKTVDGSTDYYLTCLSANDTEQEFKCKSDMSSMIGKAVEYKFNGDYISPITLKDSSISGTVDSSKSKIGTNYLSEDCKIVDIAYINNSDEAKAKSVIFSDIYKSSLSSDDIKGAAFNKDGEIIYLALNNVTLFNDKFGIITSSNGSSSTGYKINFDGESNTYPSDVNLSTGIGRAVSALIINNRIKELKNLYTVASGTISLINNQRIVIHGNTYDMAKNAVVFTSTVSGDYKLISIDNITLSEYSGAEIYSDTSVKNGGQIRIVVLKIK